MLEVLATDLGYIWRWVSFGGRTLYTAPEVFPNDLAAFAAAKRFREIFSTLTAFDNCNSCTFTLQCSHEGETK